MLTKALILFQKYAEDPEFETSPSSTIRPCQKPQENKRPETLNMSLLPSLNTLQNFQVYIFHPQS